MDSMRIKKKQIGLLILTVMIFLISRTMYAGEKDRMPDLDPDRAGTLVVALSWQDENENTVPITGVTIEVIKVAKLSVSGGSVSYQLVPEFSASGISFSGMNAASSNQAAALLKSMANTKELSGQTGKSDTHGRATFHDLEPGMYLVLQKAEEGQMVSVYSEIDPFLVSVPLADTSSDENAWNYQVETYPKAEITKKPTDGSILVKKRLSILNEGQELELTATDTSYYVGLFLDPEGKHPYSEDYRKAVHLVKSSSGEVQYTGLPSGTYYVYELDEEGNIIKNGGKGQSHGFSYTCIVEGGGSQRVTLDPEHGQGQGTVELNNRFSTMPKDFSLESLIHIKKTVMKGDENTTVDDTFYAGVFSKKNGNYILEQLTELKQNDTVTVGVSYTGNDQDSTVYWVFETDKNGKRIDQTSFGYEISGETSITLDLKHLTGEVELVNKVKEKTPSGDNPGSGSGGGSGGGGSNGPRTGDDTPMERYLLLLAGALAMILILSAVCRRIRRSGHKE